MVEAGFNSDVVECLPVDPATWVRFPAGAGKIFSLYDIIIDTPFSGIEMRVVRAYGCQNRQPAIRCSADLCTSIRGCVGHPNAVCR